MSARAAASAVVIPQRLPVVLRASPAATRLCLLVYASIGLYSASGLGAVEELRRIVLGAALVSLVLTAAAFLSKAGGGYSRGVFLCSGILMALLAPLHRAAMRRCFADKAWWGVPVVILGAGQTARALI